MSTFYMYDKASGFIIGTIEAENRPMAEFKSGAASDKGLVVMEDPPQTMIDEYLSWLG